MEPEFTNRPALLVGDSERGSELQHAWQHTHTSLLKLKRAIDSSEGMANPNEPVEGGETPIHYVFGLDTDLRRSLIYRSMSESGKDLTEPKPEITHFMILKPHYKDRIAETTSLGRNELWSSTNLSRHLLLLENTFNTTPPSGSAHAWIEAVFLRVSAMLPQNQHMIFRAMKEVVPADRSLDPDMFSLSQFVDYTVILADQCKADTYLRCPLFPYLTLGKPSTFFVIEANDPSNILSNQVQRATYQMFMCGKLLQNKIVRGALTNGHDWIFLLVKLNDDYKGASYKQSDVIHLEVMTNLVDCQQVPWPDLIAAILLNWMGNSSVDIGSDDWFEPLAL